METPSKELEVFSVPEIELHDEDPQDDLSGLAFELLTYVEQYWQMHGSVPTIDKAHQLGIQRDLYTKWMTSRPFRQKLISRGVRLPESNKWQGALTERQKNAADIVMDLADNRSKKRKLSDLEVPTAEWDTWLLDPAFVAYVNNKAEQKLKSHQYEAHLALMDGVTGGDLGAIKYYNSLVGRYNEAGNAVQVNVGDVLQGVLEALQEETKHLLEQDPDLLKRVGARLSGLVLRLEHEARGN